MIGAIVASDAIAVRAIGCVGAKQPGEKNPVRNRRRHLQLSLLRRGERRL